MFGEKAMNDSFKGCKQLSIRMFDIDLANFCWQYSGILDEHKIYTGKLGFSLKDDGYCLKPWNQIYEEDRRLYVGIHLNGIDERLKVPPREALFLYLFTICDQIMQEFERDIQNEDSRKRI